MKKTIISLSVAAMFGSALAQAAGYTPVVTTTANNFSMVGASNGTTGGNNTTVFTWDGTYRSAVVTDGSYNATFSSVTKFGGYLWTAHHANIYKPGTYTFDTGCAAGNPSCGTGPSYTLTVPDGMVGAHMLFDWNNNPNIDVVLLWDMNKSWAQTGTASAFSVVGGGNTINTVWHGVSIDTPIDADTFSGTQMIDGPFVGQSANFNVNGILPFGVASTVGTTKISGTGAVTASSQVSKASLGAPPIGIAIDDGLSYTLTGVTSGASVSLKLTFPTSITGKTIYKVSAGTFTAIPSSDYVPQADGYSILMTIRDDNGSGGYVGYDTDPTPGTITDPITTGAPVAEALTLGVSGGGGGCAFNPSAPVDSSLILTLLASLGYLGWKRKRHN